MISLTRFLKRLKAAVFDQIPVQAFGATAVGMMTELNELGAYLARNCPVGEGCPEILKPLTIAYYQERSRYNIFIETGTDYGRTTAAVKDCFAQVFTIELLEKPYYASRRRFLLDSKVVCYQGSSVEWLPIVLNAIKEPAIIWLDAHESFYLTRDWNKDPLLQELNTIGKHAQARHIILIDDARGLAINPDLFKMFLDGMRGAGYGCTMRHDIWRIVPEGIE
jgi:hypothetical protein